MSAIAATRPRRPRFFPPLAAVIGAIGWLAVATAGRAEIGVSLGFLLPADRLHAGAGPLAAPLRGAPSIGFHLGSEPGGGWGAPGWEATLEAAQFESDADRRLRMFWVPLRAGPAWEVATVEGATLTMGLAAGGAMLSARAGGPATTVGAGYTGATGRVRRELHAFIVSLGLEAGVAWAAGPRPLMAIRLRLDAKGS